MFTDLCSIDNLNLKGVLMNKIDSLQHENRKFDPPQKFSQTAWIKSFEDYQKLYQESLKSPEIFWSKRAQDFEWIKKWDKVLDYNFKDNIKIEWFAGAQTNITLNALDRQVQKTPERLAYIWVGNEPGVEKKITYRELHQQVCQAANALKSIGVKKGDRVTIYLPMIPELPVSLLACARIGAIHSVVFGGFSAEALKDRLIDAQSHVLITADEGLRGPKSIPLKEIADQAMALCQKEKHTIQTCLVISHTGKNVSMQTPRDKKWADLLSQSSSECEIQAIDAEDALFILYTSGSTGKPKGVLHTTAGYMVYAATTFKYVFDYHPEDIFFCTADIGWVTGHSYLVYGPLCNGATSILFEGVPNYPAPDRFWDIVEKYKVSIFYTAPTALRALMREGTAWPQKHSLSSLRLLGSVGEPINPEAWMWYHENIGQGQCPIVDTWWQTETGGILITPLPGATLTKPGSASFPFFGVEPAIIRDDGSPCDVNEGGYLILKKPWPGIMRTVYGHHERFKETYFSRFPGSYFTGDGARQDEDGLYWLMGRVDDVLNVSGHRIGTAEVESALVAHPDVAEAAVVGFPHEIKGQGIYAFVTPKNNCTIDLAQLQAHVRKEIGAIAVPDKIQFANSLPKTRSGKIMRRILRKIAEGITHELGDTSTLADPSVVDDLIKNRI